MDGACLECGVEERKEQKEGGKKEEVVTRKMQEKVETQEKVNTAHKTKKKTKKDLAFCMEREKKAERRRKGS